MKKRFLLTSVLMLLLTLLAVSTSTYAWFTMTSENYVENISITAAEATGGLQISSTGSSWGSSKITVDTGNTAWDLTADKTGRIYQRVSGNDADLTDITEENNLDVDYYNQFDIYFKTTSYGAIVLDLSESYIVPAVYEDLVKNSSGAYLSSSAFAAAAVAKETALAGDGWNKVENRAFQTGDAAADIEKFSDATIAADYNKSTYGDISRDWIAAAFRMSFEVIGYEATYNDNWVGGASSKASQPIKFVKALDTITTSINGRTNKYSVLTGGSASNVLGVKPIDNFTPTNANDDNDKNAIVANTETETYTYTAAELLTSGTVKIAAISSGIVGETGGSAQTADDLIWEQGKSLFVKVRVRMWIEGQDAEAILPFTGGKIAAGLKFKLDQTNYANPTDYRTVINFTTFTADQYGFGWTIPTAAIVEGSNVMIYKDLATAITKDTTALPEETTGVPYKTVARDVKMITETLTTGATYYIVAKVDQSFEKTGYKVDGVNSFKVLKSTYAGQPADAKATDYDYYVFATVEY